MRDEDERTDGLRNTSEGLERQRPGLRYGSNSRSFDKLTQHDWILIPKTDAGPDGIYYKCNICGAMEQVFRDHDVNGVMVLTADSAAPSCEEEICRQVLNE